MKSVSQIVKHKLNEYNGYGDYYIGSDEILSVRPEDDIRPTNWVGGLYDFTTKTIYQEDKIPENAGGKHIFTYFSVRPSEWGFSQYTREYDEPDYIYDFDICGDMYGFDMNIKITLYETEFYEGKWIYEDKEYDGDIDDADWEEFEKAVKNFGYNIYDISDWEWEQC